MFIVTSLLLFSSAAFLYADTVSLPATGQKKCYDTWGTEISCTGTGQDGDKKTGVTWPSPRFTGSGDCITDTLTGLIWAKNAYLPNVTKTWQQALDYVAALNTGAGLCGYNTGWRLPQILELESLVNLGYNGETCGTSACYSVNAWLNTQGFTNAKSEYYWASSTNAGSTQEAWAINMYYGVVGFGNKSLNVYLLPVRDGQSSSGTAKVWKTGQTTKYASGDNGDLQKGISWPSPRFTDSGDGTVKDNLTALIWLKNANCFNNSMTWQTALDAANSLASGQCGLSDGSHAGDWRQPNRKELLSLVDYSRYLPALPAGHPFTNVQSDNYWSASNFGTSSAWAVYMNNGGSDFGNKTRSSYVWPVKGGQSAAAQNNCAASLSASLVIHLPVVTYGGSNYWADLQYNSSTSTLTLTNAGVVNDMSPYANCTASSLTSGLRLHIPVLVVNNISYLLDFQYNGSAFAITGFAQN